MEHIMDTLISEGDIYIVLVIYVCVFVMGPRHLELGCWYCFLVCISGLTFIK